MTKNTPAAQAKADERSKRAAGLEPYRDWIPIGLAPFINQAREHRLASYREIQRLEAENAALRQQVEEGNDT